MIFKLFHGEGVNRIFLNGDTAGGNINLDTTGVTVNCAVVYLELEGRIVTAVFASHGCIGQFGDIGDVHFRVGAG